VDAIVVFDDVLVPWENVLFYRHTRAAHFLRETLNRYSAFTFLQRSLKLADMLIGTALHNARQTGVEKLQAVQDRLAGLACYREGINAHLTAAIALGVTGFTFYPVLGPVITAVSVALAAASLVGLLGSAAALSRPGRRRTGVGPHDGP